MSQRYYFDLRDDGDITRDEEGVELLSIEAALEKATLALSDMARAMSSDDVGAGRQMAVEVRDEIGPLLQAYLGFELRGRRIDHADRLPLCSAKISSSHHWAKAPQCD